MYSCKAHSSCGKPLIGAGSPSLPLQAPQLCSLPEPSCPPTQSAGTAGADIRMMTPSAGNSRTDDDSSTHFSSCEDCNKYMNSHCTTHITCILHMYYIHCKTKEQCVQKTCTCTCPVHICTYVCSTCIIQYMYMCIQCNIHVHESHVIHVQCT